MKNSLFASFPEEDSNVYGSLEDLETIIWRLALLLCRRCWLPWWKHGHGPFSLLIDKPASHLFDAL